MSWMMGAGLGFFMGGPLGAVVGGALQHILGQEAKKALQYGTALNPTNQEALFITYLVSMMTKIAMADGHISPKERRAIHDFLTRQMRYQGDDLKYIDSLIEQTEKINPDLRQIAGSFRKMTNYESSLMILDICYQIAISDNHITAEEQHELKALASYLGITAYEHERIKYKYSNNSSGHSSVELKDAISNNYSILGINSNASNEEVKSAYRQMVSQYHPDKVSHLGKELIEFANQKFLEINKAYENIKKQRTF